MEWPVHPRPLSAASDSQIIGQIKTMDYKITTVHQSSGRYQSQLTSIFWDVDWSTNVARVTRKTKRKIITKWQYLSHQFFSSFLGQRNTSCSYESLVDSSNMVPRYGWRTLLVRFIRCLVNSRGLVNGAASWIPGQIYTGSDYANFTYIHSKDKQRKDSYFHCCWKKCG